MIPVCFFFFFFFNNAMGIMYICISQETSQLEKNFKIEQRKLSP